MQYFLLVPSLALSLLATSAAQGTPTVLWSAQDLTGGIKAVKISPDGRFLAYSASSDPRVHIRRVSDGTLVRVVTANTAQAVESLAFAPSSQVLATVWNRFHTVGTFTYSYGGAEIWNSDLSVLQPVSTAGYHRDYCTAVAFAPDGLSFATVAKDFRVFLWDSASGLEIGRVLHGAYVLAVDFTRDGRYLISAGSDQRLKLWDVNTGIATRSFVGHTDQVREIAVSPDLVHFASGAGGATGSDNTVKIWDINGSTSVMTLSGHTAQIEGLDYSRSGSFLGSASIDGTVRFWDASSGVLLVWYNLLPQRPYCFDIAPGDATFAYGLNNGTVVLARR